ncbi:hypothetical protein [Pygmaiobacter massiliensis]|uniref:hypothetical protein n=1 Tax=Pygmaiobacter massiliensis TaxID=1917873 RepID=UPI000C7C95A6|nr:hypothetical protein [Pygmaiobacter massiliensis]
MVDESIAKPLNFRVFAVLFLLTQVTVRGYAKHPILTLFFARWRDVGEMLSPVAINVCRLLLKFWRDIEAKNGLRNHM